MSQSKIKQDMPPPGGYRPIQYLRIPAKTYFSGKTMFFGFVVMQIGAWYILKLNDWLVRRWDTEERGCRMAMLPMLLAEKERLYLKNARHLRDEERRVMKDVPGWVVGTWWGEPIYKAISKDQWYDILDIEYYTHNSYYDYRYCKHFYKQI